jgi:hypothetical protein
MSSKKYRLYIDESGTHNYSKSDEIRERYLCLNGLIISAEHNQDFITPKWDALREIFTEDPDFPAVFHLSDLMEKIGVFKKLEDDAIKSLFDERYLEILKDGNFILCSVVLDKKTHLETYGDAAMHPYHYCLNVLLERYVKFLLENDGYGDVVAEVRGKKEDQKLRSEFEHFYENGTHYVNSDTVQKRLSSNKLKLKTKEARIAGLELSDMLATPMKFLTLYKYERILDLSDNFTKSVLELVHPKIRRCPYNKKRTKGFGVKLI